MMRMPSSFKIHESFISFIESLIVGLNLRLGKIWDGTGLGVFIPYADMGWDLDFRSNPTCIWDGIFPG